MPNPNWKVTKQPSGYTDAVLNIGYTVANVEEVAETGYGSCRFNKRKPDDKNVYTALIGHRLILKNPKSALFDTLEEAQEAVEMALRQAARETLDILKV